MTATERVHLYSTAPNLFITTRILAVDLLTARLQHHQVAGIIVLNAHRASDDSGEGFAVRLLRAKTKTAFVRGLCDDAGQLSVGLSGMEHSMRALLVSRVFFWPRFQETVQKDLGHVDVCVHSTHHRSSSWTDSCRASVIRKRIYRCCLYI